VRCFIKGKSIVGAPWYVLNTVILRNLQIPTAKEEIRCCSSQYSALLSTHPNDLIANLIELLDNRRLRRQRSSTVLLPRPTLITPCGKLQKNLKSLKLLHRFGRHKEHEQESMLIKRRPSPITLPLYSSLTHLNLTPFLTTPSHHYWKPLPNSNPLSTASNGPRFKQ
jgi:hypothetical protein